MNLGIVAGGGEWGKEKVLYLFGYRFWEAGPRCKGQNYKAGAGPVQTHVEV
jgi:hypothetical protein